MITLRFDIDPVAKARARVTRAGHAYTPQKTRQFENAVRVMSRAQWKAKPLCGAITAILTFYLRPPVRRVRSQPTCKPDLDNLIKAVKDSVNGIVWLDDAQVTEMRAVKVYDWVGRRGWIELSVSEGNP